MWVFGMQLRTSRYPHAMVCIADAKLAAPATEPQWLQSWVICYSLARTSHLASIRTAARLVFISVE